MLIKPYVAYDCHLVYSAISDLLKSGREGDNIPDVEFLCKTLNVIKKFIDEGEIEEGEKIE